MPSTPGSRVVIDGRKEATPVCGVRGRPPGGGAAVTVVDPSLEPSDSGASASSLATSSVGRLSPSSVPSSQSMLAVHRCRLIDWSPSAVAALAPSLDGTTVAVARESGQIELWSSAAGSVGWNCFATIPGRKESSISSLLWCEGQSPCGRLFSAGLDGLLVEWDVCTLRQKAVVDSLGGPVWAMAVEPSDLLATKERKKPRAESNGVCESGDGVSDVSDGEGGENDDDDTASANEDGARVQRVAVACDDGRVRLFTVEDGPDGMAFERALPPVTGRVLSVAWATPEKLFAGGADGCIRCWDLVTMREAYRITVAVGSQKRENICVWSLLWLRSGILVSGDSTGSTQFWDGEMGTLLHSHKRHQADVLTLAATPSQTSVFAAGIDGQVIIYQEVSKAVQNEKSERYSKEEELKDWVYVGSRRSHTHDIKALAVFVVPNPAAEGRDVGRVDSSQNLKRKLCSRIQAVGHAGRTGATMLLSGGNDAELRIYPANAFLSFAPFSICPTPEPPVIQMVTGAMRMQPMLISQHKEWVDIWEVRGGSTMSLRESVENRARSVTASPGSVADDRSDMDNVGSDREGGRAMLAVAGANGLVREYGSVDGPEGRSGDGSEACEQRILANGIPPRLLARIKSRGSDHIVCSSLSPDGKHVAFSDRVKVRLFQLEKRCSQGGGMEPPPVIIKRRLPMTLPPAHQVVFSADASRFILATASGSILVVDVNQPTMFEKISGPQFVEGNRDECSTVSLLCTSQDGQWVAAVNMSRRLNLFNLESLRHHWSMTSPDGAQITAMVFHPGSGALIIATTLNKIHVLDVEARCLANWSRVNEKRLPRQLLEIPGCITGLSVPPSAHSATLIAYNSRHMCVINLSKPVQERVDAVKEEQSVVSKGRSDALYACNGTQSLVENRNFLVVRMNHRCLFLGHLTEDSVFLVEKPWVEVMAKFPAPLYRHQYGT